MKKRITVFAAMSVALASSSVQAVTGMDRLVFTPSFIFEEGNFAELTLARSTPSVSPDFTSNNVANVVDTARFAYKHQISDKVGLGFVISNQPVGVDVDYSGIPGLDDLRGQVSAKSYIALGHYKATENISVLGGVKYQTQRANANLSNLNPMLPTPLNFSQDSDTGFILGAAYSKPDIAFRASLTYESDLSFDHDTNLQGFGDIGNTSSATPRTLTLEVQSGIAKDTLLFGSIRRAEWDDAQIVLLEDTINEAELSNFADTTAYKIGIGRKFTDAISGSVTLNYERSTGQDSSLFSPQDGERGIALAGRYLFNNGVATSLLVQYRKLGDTETSNVPISFEDNDVVTFGLRISKSF